MAVGDRISEDGATVAYIPDHEPLLGAARLLSSDWISGFELAAHADLLIHDSRYSATRYPTHVGWGHSAIPHVVEFAACTGVKRLVTFHHDPRHDDAALDRLVDQARSSADLPFEILPGVEGACFEC